VDRLPLKPTVLTLAMLLPITSILVWCERKPDTLENMDIIIGFTLLALLADCRCPAVSV
jgi:hypothetical protein